MIRVRFSPSPTGFLHVGGARTALYNQLFALHNQGELVLRIEDTDQSRLVPGATLNIVKTLKALGITPSEGVWIDSQDNLIERGEFGPYTQSERLDIYKKQADILLNNGAAYRYFCTAEELEGIRQTRVAAKLPASYDGRCKQLSTTEIDHKLAAHQPFVIRLNAMLKDKITFKDLIRGEISFGPESVDDVVLLKSDGFPTYHLAVVVDDHFMNITHVIRGEEWIPSTPKHLLLYKAFGWVSPEFAHVPLLLNPDKSKLSKRQGDVAAEDYLNKGYLPDALINFLALLGWNPTADREIYSRIELAEYFEISKINKGGAIFNVEKLNWFNKEYIKKLTEDEFIRIAQPFLASLNDRDTEKLRRALTIERERVTKLTDLPDLIDYLFVDQLKVDPNIVPAKKSTPVIAKDRLEKLLDFFEQQSVHLFETPRELEELTINFIKSSGFTNSETLWPLRLALTGKAASPGPFDVAWVLGKETTLNRIKQTISLLS